MIVVSRPRPATPPEPLSASVTVNLTPTEKKQLAAAAKTAKVSMSAYGRAAILKALGGAR